MDRRINPYNEKAAHLSSKLTILLVAVAIVAIACASPTEDAAPAIETPLSSSPSGAESTATVVSPTRETTAPIRETVAPGSSPLLGSVWEYHATSTDGLDINTTYTVIGAAELGGVPAYVLGNSMKDQNDVLVEYGAFYVRIDDFQWIDRDGVLMFTDEGVPEANRIKTEGAESITVTAGTFDTTRLSAGIDDIRTTAWVSPDLVRPVMSRTERTGRSASEELVSISSVDPSTAEEAFFNNLVDTLESDLPHQTRASALKALGNLSAYTREAEIVELIQRYQSDHDYQVVRTADLVLEFISEGSGNSPSLTQTSSVETAERVRGHSAPTMQAIALLEGIGVIADALEIFGSVSDTSLSGSNKITIKHPVGCDDGTLGIALDVGDVVASVPIEVDYSLGWARDYGYWQFPIFVASIWGTYRYDLFLKTADGELLAQSVSTLR